MPSTAGTGTKTATPNEQKMAGSLMLFNCHSIRCQPHSQRFIFSECNLLTRALRDCEAGTAFVTTT
jgi:hypothetical protein